MRVYAGVDVLTGHSLYLRRTIAAGPKARREAERVCDDLVRQVAENRQPKTNAPLVTLLERHLEHSETERRNKETLRGYLRKHIAADKLGRLPVGRVSVEALEVFYAKLRRCRERCDGSGQVRHVTEQEHICTLRCRPHECRPLARNTVRKIHFLVSGAYEDAVRWDWVSDNPARRARKPGQAPPNPKPPTAEEAAALVMEAWRCGFGPYVWLAMTTGARRGEMCALRWADLQADHAELGHHECVVSGCRFTLVIDDAICQSMIGGELWISDTKAHQRRHVALDPETVAVLMEHRRHCEQLAATTGTELTNDCYIFASTPDGRTPCKPESVTARYRRLARRLGIATNLHGLRHFSATELITAGVDVRTVAGRLGHSGGGAITLKVYAAWVEAAGQHASTVLMHRMPPRPVEPVDRADRARQNPRWPHERLAVQIEAAWRDGALAAGSELTAKVIAEHHHIAPSTAHRVLTLLNQWGVLTIRPGQRSIVNAPDVAPAERSQPGRPAPAAVPSLPSVAPMESAQQPRGVSTETRKLQLVSPVTSETDQAENRSQADHGPRLLTLDLIHLGTRVRRLQAQADPDDFDALQRLMRDAVRRTGADLSDLGDYEMAVHLPGDDGPIATVVIAA